MKRTFFRRKGAAGAAASPSAAGSAPAAEQKAGEGVRAADMRMTDEQRIEVHRPIGLEGEDSRLGLCAAADPL